MSVHKVNCATSVSHITIVLALAERSICRVALLASIFSQESLFIRTDGVSKHLALPPINDSDLLQAVKVFIMRLLAL
jgi:hypothetical protein